MTVDQPNASAGRIACAQCRRDIDASARLCPYCGADPRTGRKPVDTQAMIETMFQPHETTASETVVDFARRRQGVVIALGVLLGFLLLAGLHEYVTRRNARLVSSAAAIPLTEVADLSDQPDENRPLPLPKLELQFDGHPQVMRTFVVEPDAVTPPDVLAAQQAAKQQAPVKPTPAIVPPKPPKH